MKHRGFTLFEVLLVIAIAVSLTALGAISMTRLQRIFLLRSVADELKSRIQYGRELATANLNRSSYQVTLSGGIFRLTGNNVEISRFLIPPDMTISPPLFSWTFAPVTGTLSSCSPCQITLKSGEAIQIINVAENGLVD